MNKQHWRWSEVVGLGLTALALTIVAFMQQDALRQLQAQASEQFTDAEYERQNAQTIAQMRLLANLPSFGFDNLVADWAFLQFLQFFGDSAARQVTGYDEVPAFFEVIIAKDPRFAQTYPYLSTAITVYAGQPQTSVALMDRGL
ncbi:MAG TPA: hypothetical protein IGP91_05415, partial [Thermosynechococcus sp. M46_R2017_013]|nr:hypothetical protein [Thermosynechococcus sp. M46_R2017_013]